MSRSQGGPRRVGSAAMVPILGSAFIAGLLGYVSTWLVFRVAGAEVYNVFAVFWSAVYFLFGALAGTQYEVARATHPVAAPAEASRLPWRLLLVGGGLALLVSATAPLWVAQLFPVDGWSFLPPLIIGIVGCLATGVLAGTVSGLRHWRLVATTTIVDSALRVGFVAGGLALGFPPMLLAWCVAAPFGLAALVLAPWYARVLRLGYWRDVPDGHLLRNVVVTLGASTATALAVNALPALIAATSPDVEAVALSNVLFSLMLLRAPLIMIAGSLQGAMIVGSRGLARRGGPTLVRVGLLVGAGVVLAALAGLVGGPVMNWLAGRPLGLDGWFYAQILLSSAGIAAMFATGASLLAARQHRANLIGWVCAAAATCGSLLLPCDFGVRLALALFVGPALGLAVHLVTLSVAEHRLRGSTPVPQ